MEVQSSVIVYIRMKIFVRCLEVSAVYKTPTNGVSKVLWRSGVIL